MAGHLGLDALGLELAGKAIHAGREHAEPASQQEHARFSGERAVAPQQGDGDREAAGAEAQTRCVAIFVCAHRREWAAVFASDPCNHLSHCPLFQPERPFVTSVTCAPFARTCSCRTCCRTWPGRAPIRCSRSFFSALSRGCDWTRERSKSLCRLCY